MLSPHKVLIMRPLITPNELLALTAISDDLYTSFGYNSDLYAPKKPSVGLRYRLIEGQFYVTKIQDNNRTEDNEDNVDTIEECFALLEISCESSPYQIKAVYRKRIAEYHPDKVEKLGRRLKELAEKETKKLNSAHKLLKAHGHLYE